MIRAVLLRHGMTEGNKEARYIGTTDEPLCEEGILKVREKANKVCTGSGIGSQIVMDESAHWIVSPMKRCLETAEIFQNMILQSKNVSQDEAFYNMSLEYEIQHDLRECDFGLFENRNYKDMNGDPLYQAWIDSGGRAAFPNGESPDGFSKRCTDAFEKRVQTAADDEQLVFVVHGGTIMSIMEKWGLTPEGTKKGYYDWHVKNACGYAVNIARKASDLSILALRVADII